MVKKILISQPKPSSEKSPYFDIAKEFGKNHTTVLYAIRRVEEELRNTSNGLQDNIRDITANINSRL